MNRRNVTLALAVLAVPALAALAQACNDGGVHVVEGTTAPGTSPAWAADKRFLVGAADDVFVGRVVRAEDRLSVSETSTPPSSPESQFAVEVGRTIKGGLSGTVTVNQGGGYVEYAADRDYPKEGVEKGQSVRQLVVLEETPLLEVGREYMFVTTYDRENGWHEMVGTGRSSSVEVKGQVQREALLESYERAKRNQANPHAAALLEPAPRLARGTLVHV